MKTTYSENISRLPIQIIPSRGIVKQYKALDIWSGQISSWPAKFVRPQTNVINSLGPSFLYCKVKS